MVGRVMVVPQKTGLFSTIPRKKRTMFNHVFVTLAISVTKCLHDSDPRLCQMFEMSWFERQVYKNSASSQISLRILSGLQILLSNWKIWLGKRKGLASTGVDWITWLHAVSSLPVWIVFLKLSEVSRDPSGCWCSVLSWHAGGETHRKLGWGQYVLHVSTLSYWRQSHHCLAATF